MTHTTKINGAWPSMPAKPIPKIAAKKAPQKKAVDKSPVASMPIDMIETPRSNATKRAKSGNRPPIDINTLDVGWVDPPAKAPPVRHYYDRKFNAMEHGQSIVCDVNDVGRIAASMRSWLRRKNLPGRVQTYTNHPVAGKGTVTWSRS